MAVASGAFVLALGAGLAVALATAARGGGGWRARARELARQRDEAAATRGLRLEALAGTLRALEGSATDAVRRAHRGAERAEGEALERDERRAVEAPGAPSAGALARAQAIDRVAGELVIALLARLLAESRYRWSVLEAMAEQVDIFKTDAINALLYLSRMITNINERMTAFGEQVEALQAAEAVSIATIQHIQTTVNALNDEIQGLLAVTTDEYGAKLAQFATSLSTVMTAVDSVVRAASPA